MTARALTARPARFFLGAGSTALALALGVAPLALTATAHADNGQGTITVHDAATGIEDQSNQPKVCGFRLVADGYPDSKTTFTFDFEDKTDGVLHVSPGVITLSNGSGQTGVLWLTKDHMYKPHGAGPDENGNDNFKVFKETCEEPTDGGGTPPTTGVTPPTTGVTPPTTGVTPPTTGVTPPTTGVTPPTTGVTPPTTSTGGEPTTGTSGAITGGGTGATVTPVSHPVTKPVSKPVSKPVTRGGGAVTTAHELPFTGDRTSSLALWGFASLLGGIGFTALGGRKAQRVR